MDVLWFFFTSATMIHGGDLDEKGHCESSLYGIVSQLGVRICHA